MTLTENKKKTSSVEANFKDRHSILASEIQLIEKRKYADVRHL
jgi:hypothetical protein